MYERVLPVDTGFLTRYGFSSDSLRDAAILASSQGVSTDEFLIKSGYIEEATFYRALAAELSLPFLTVPRLSGEARYPNAILAGIAPSAGSEGGFIIAPRGALLARLLSRPHVPEGVVAVTSPSILARAVFRRQSQRIAHRAAQDLPEHAPDLSSRDGADTRQITALAITALVLSFGGNLLPQMTLACIGMVLSPIFLSMAIMRLSAAILANPVETSAKPPRADDQALPTYTVIVALYRERGVVARLIEALTKIDYPAAKLDIKLVLEADDAETPAALSALHLPSFIEVIVAPPGAPRTKPRALNVALPLARGRFTVIYDAEDVPHPGQLRLAVSLFASLPADTACLQARLTIDNTDDSWLTKLFTIEYAALFDVFNPGLAVIGSPITLGGTSNHFRTDVLKEICGWDAWNVTEDADLGIRLARLGYCVQDLPSSTLEEAPSTLGAWMKQRTRWMKGYVQTCVAHSRHPGSALRQLGLWRFVGAVALTFGTVLSALLYPLFTGLFVIQWIRGPIDELASTWGRLWYAGSLTLFVTGAVAIFVPATVALGRRRLWRLLPWLLLLPIYYALVSIAAWRGLWELAVAPFRWNKTNHGLARTSRTGQLQKHQARPARTRSLKTEPP